MTRETLDRQDWNTLCRAMCGPEIETASARVRPPVVDVELTTEDGVINDVAVYGHRDATDIRVGRVQFLVSFRHLIGIRSVGSYPIKTWEVIYDGPLVDRDD